MLNRRSKFNAYRERIFNFPGKLFDLRLNPDDKSMTELQAILNSGASEKLFLEIGSGSGRHLIKQALLDLLLIG